MMFPNNKIFSLLVISSLTCISQLPGQGVRINPEYEEYFKKYTHIAIEEMRQYGIPASITLAQGVLESNCGKSELAVEANNHFGIKCHDDWKGPTYIKDDDEKNECFRKYTKAEDSFRDHSEFLTSKSRYAFLLSLDADDYTGWARGLKTAGYASNPQYPQLLIRIIEDNKLFLLDDSKNNAGIANNRSLNRKDRDDRDYDHDRDISVYKELRKSRLGRPVLSNNQIPFIFAKNGDSFKSIASEFRIYPSQVVKYNDMQADDVIRPGQFVYLEPKKRKGEQKFHNVRSNENLWQISQRYGIKLKKLARYNHRRPGESLASGQVIRLAR